MLEKVGSPLSIKDMKPWGAPPVGHVTRSMDRRRPRGGLVGGGPRRSGGLVWRWKHGLATIDGSWSGAPRVDVAGPLGLSLEGQRNLPSSTHWFHGCGPSPSVHLTVLQLINDNTCSHLGKLIEDIGFCFVCVSYCKTQGPFICFEGYLLHYSFHEVSALLKSTEKI